MEIKYIEHKQQDNSSWRLVSINDPTLVKKLPTSKSILMIILTSPVVNITIYGLHQIESLYYMLFVKCVSTSARKFRNRSKIEMCLVY